MWTTEILLNETWGGGALLGAKVMRVKVACGFMSSAREALAVSLVAHPHGLAMLALLRKEKRGMG